MNPNNAVIPPQDPNGQQQQATETSPPAGSNLFSQQFANQLSPGNNLLSQQFSQAVQSNHRDQLTDSNSPPVDASNQVPSTSNQLLGDNGEKELCEPSIIQPIGPNPVHHHTRQYYKFSHCYQTCGSNHPARIYPQVATS